jgi:hypothetical protein
MSISTPGGSPERVPSTVSTDKKPPGGAKPPGGKPGGAKPGAGKAGSAKPGAGKPGGGKPGGGKGGPRKPIAAVKVNQSRNWGPIALTGVVLLIAVGIIGWAGYASFKGTRSYEENANAIKGIVNYRNSKDATIASRQHKQGPLTYTTSPPVGGDHNPTWQNCSGDVYTQPIANEHAVHSLEHGAVWVTYKLGMPADQVKVLSDKVTGKDFMMISPIEGLDANVSLQAWGYQLKVDTVTDARIDEFIKALRVKASQEPGAACSGGTSNPGPVEPAAPATAPSAGS